MAAALRQARAIPGSGSRGLVRRCRSARQIVDRAAADAGPVSGPCGLKMSTPEILEKDTVHEGWAKYSLLKVRLPDGNVANREMEEHGPAVSVLPYDPE